MEICIYYHYVTCCFGFKYVSASNNLILIFKNAITYVFISMKKAG